jgi:hypothetical protein
MIEQKIAGIIAMYTQIICERVKAKWGNMQGIQGKAGIYAGLPTIIGPMVSQSIDATGQKAWIAEFGSGSTMDTSSPYYSTYRGSSNFNPSRRSDNSITGRPAGEYLDLDGNIHVSTGTNEGRDLEAKPVYTHMLPMHIIEFEIREVLPDLRAAIAVAVQDEVKRIFTMSIQISL